jgi:hypothetical protein
METLDAPGITVVSTGFGRVSGVLAIDVKLLIVDELEALSAMPPGS